MNLVFPQIRKLFSFLLVGEFGLGKNKTFEIFKILVESFKNFQLIAIAGRNKKMKELFLEFINKKNRIKDIKIEFQN